MKLMLHIVGKDFARLRGRLAVWLGLVALKFALGIWVVRWADIDGDLLVQMQLGILLLIVTDVAFTLLLGALLVQEDGVAGTAAFWRTRPISRGRLLAAKLFGGLLMLVLPAVVVAVPWWWVCGFDAGQVGRAAVDVVLWQGALLAVAFAAAAVTTSLGRCLVWGGVAVALVIVTNGVVNQALGRMVFNPWIQGPLLVLTLAVTIGVQFLAGRRTWTLAALGFGTSAALFGLVGLRELGRWSPEKVWAGGVRSGDVRPELLRDVGVTFKSVEVARGLRRGDTTQGWIHLRFGAVGVPTGLQALVRRATLTWRGEGELNARQVSGWGGGYYSWRAAALAVARASGEGRPSERMEDADLSFSGMVVGDELIRLRARPVEAVAELQIELRRPEVCFDLPVARPVWSSGHGRGARVLGTEPVRAEMRTLLLETESFSLLDQFEQAVRGPLSPGSDVYYVIRNARGEVTTNSQGAPIGGVLLGGVLIRTRKLDVSDPARKFGSVERSPADWLESVSLTAVRFSVVAAGSREVKIPRLELK